MEHAIGLIIVLRGNREFDMVGLEAGILPISPILARVRSSPLLNQWRVPGAVHRSPAIPQILRRWRGLGKTSTDTQEDRRFSVTCVRSLLGAKTKLPLRRYPKIQENRAGRLTTLGVDPSRFQAEGKPVMIIVTAIIAEYDAVGAERWLYHGYYVRSHPKSFRSVRCCFKLTVDKVYHMTKYVRVYRSKNLIWFYS